MQKRNYNRKTVKKSKKALTKPQQNAVKKMIHSQIEDKYTDYLYAYANQDYQSGLHNPVQLSSGIAQGIAQSERIGDKINIKSLRVRMSIYHSTASAIDPVNNYRIVIFKWKLSTAISTPVVGGILQYTSGVASLNYGVDSPYLFKNKQDDDFAILYDKRFSLSPWDRSTVHDIKLSKFLGNINYVPGATTGSGHIYMFVQCDDGSVLTACPVIGFISRLIYEDA